MSPIIWIASYPKSGNTWLRAFLANYASDGSQPVELDDLGTDGIATDRDWFDELVGLESSNLLDEEIDEYRPELYELLAESSPEPLWIKVHDAFGYNAAGRALFPATATKLALYVLRCPLDVAVSLRHHLAISLDRSIDLVVGEAKSGARSPGLSRQLRHDWRSWGEHVSSWVDEAPFPVHVLRYEDMLARPLETFGAAARAAGLAYDPARVARAVAHSHFEVLAALEQAKGFVERPAKAEKFFREGRSGGWRHALSPAQVDRIIQAHGEPMKRFGYAAGLDAIGADSRANLPG